MSTYTGKVLNGFGELVGSGLEVDGSGVVVNILPVTETLPEGWITPGLIDIHNHGGGGASFPDDTTPEGTATAVEAHRCMGTTALVASTVSSSIRSQPFETSCWPANQETSSESTSKAHTSPNTSVAPKTRPQFVTLTWTNCDPGWKLEKAGSKP